MPANVREAFQAMRLRLSRSKPYLAPVLYRMRGPIVRDDLPFHTLAVDSSWRIYIDPAVLERWDVEQLTTVLEHEAWHLVMHHPRRGVARCLEEGSVEHACWQAAVDCVVNAMIDCSRLPGLITADRLDLPPGRTADEYYALLMERCSKSEGEQVDAPEGGGSCGDGVPRAWEEAPNSKPTSEEDPGAPGDFEAEQIARAVAEEIVRSGRQAGYGGRDLLRWAEGVLAPPTVPWQRVLASTVRAGLADVAGRVDYSYRRPSRRQGASSVVLPSMRRPAPTVAVVVDTSGSMERHDLDAAMAEVGGVLSALGGMDVTLLSCDHEVEAAQRVITARTVRLIGGGGTDMGAGLAAAARLRPRPDITIVITDGETGWPDAPPRCGRVIVCLVQPTGHATPAWARVVEVKS